MSKIIWAKLDPGFYSNRKVIRAGRNGREVFVFALCANASRGAKGSIPAQDLEPWYVARQLGVSEEDAEDGVTRALAAGLLVRVGDDVQIKGWDDDWSRRPLTRSEIQKGYRERSQNRYQDEVTSDHEEKTLPIDQRDRSERETGSHSLSASPDRSGSQQSQTAATRAARGVNQQPIAAAWKPTEAAAEFAQSHGLSLAHEAEQFRRVAKAKGHTYADVDAAFEVFMSRSRDRGKPAKKPGATTPKPKPVRVRDELGQMLEEGPDGELRPLEKQEQS